MNIGFIGTGSMAKVHAQVIRSLGHKIAFVHARNNSRTLDYFMSVNKGCNAIRDIDKLLEIDECDAFIVTTPPEVTEILLPNFYSSQKFMLIEKPGFLSPAAVTDFLDSQKMFFGYNRRFYSSIRRLSQNVREEISNISFIVAEGSTSSDAEKIDILTKNSVHYFDLVNWLFPSSTLENFRLSSDRNHLESDIYLESNFIGTIAVKFNAPMNSQISATANDKFILLKPIEVCAEAHSLEVTEPDHENPIRVYTPILETFAADDNEKVFKPGIFNQDRAFIDVVMRKEGPKSYMGLANLSDALLAIQSAEKFANLIRVS